MLRRVFPQAEIMPPGPVTAKTVELGARHSPDFVCMPFKYNLGNYIEALDKGATVLMGAGGGCRYGFYGELHELILKDLGYDFEYVNFFECGKSVLQIYKLCKKLGSPLSLPRFLLTAHSIIKILAVMDKGDFFIRQNSCLEIKPIFDWLRDGYLGSLSAYGGKKLNSLTRDYSRNLGNVKFDKNKETLRIGLVGELFSLIEPTAQAAIERALINSGAAVTRHTNLTYLVFQKTKSIPQLLNTARPYIDYHLGADATGTVAHAIDFAENDYDGIIHLKPFGCTPELNAIPFLEQISRDYKIPVLYLSFDTQTTPTGVGTRIEAFVESLKEKTKWITKL